MSNKDKRIDDLEIKSARQKIQQAARVKIYKKRYAILTAIAPRSVFGRILRCVRGVTHGATRSMITVINCLAFLAGFRGAMRAIAL